MTRAHARLVTAISLFVAALGVYSPTLSFQFTLDDYSHVVNNFQIRTLTGAVNGAFEPLFPGNLFRPTAILSYGLTYYFAGLEPYWYHLTNIMLHGLVVVLVYLLALEFVELLPAAFIGLIFALHPVQTEVVSNISHRTEMLASIFILGTILCALRRYSGSAGHVILIVALSFLALLSKENSVVLLALLPFSVWFRGGDRRTIGVCLMALAISLTTYLAIRVYVLGLAIGLAQSVSFIDNPLIDSAPVVRIVNGLLYLGRYFSLILGPWQLSADYSYYHLPVISTLSLGAIMPAILELVALLTLVVGLVLGRKSRKQYSLFAGWFLISFLVTANILFPVGTIFAERLLYLPSIGAIGFLVSLVFEHFTRFIAVLSLTLCSIPLLMKTIAQEQIWRDQTTLCTYQIEVSADSAKTQSNYGIVLRNQGALDDASVHFRQALQIYPDFSEPAYGLATVYLAKGVRSGAYHWLHQALRKNSNFSPALITLGKMYLEEGKLDQARNSFGQALAINPDDFEASLGLLAVAVNRAEISNAQRLLQSLKEIDPNYPKLREIETIIAGMTPHN